jgi:hypothetical protein
MHFAPQLPPPQAAVQVPSQLPTHSPVHVLEQVPVQEVQLPVQDVHWYMQVLAQPDMHVPVQVM